MLKWRNFARVGRFTALIIMLMAGWTTCPASFADKPFELKSLTPTFDILPARPVLKGMVGHTEEMGGAAVNIFGYAESTDGKGNHLISYVRPYTAAWRSGLSVGDKVLGVHVELPKELLTIERAGKKYSCLLETKQKLPSPTAPVAGGIKTDAERLAQHAMVMLIDSSASMQTADCPGNVTRWQWCKDHVKELYAADKGRAQNISFITFDSNFRSHRNSLMSELPNIFQDTEPAGETYMAPAVAEAFSLVRNQLSYGQPAIVTIVSDGRPSDAERLKSTIISQVNSLAKPELLSIVFIEVGTPEKYLKELDSELTKQGAKADVVSVIPFSKASEQGLVKALASTLPKPKTEETATVKASITATNAGENKAKAAISAHIFVPPAPGSGAVKTVVQVAPPVKPHPIAVQAHPIIKAHPAGTSLEAKAGSLPKEVDEREQVLKNSANKTYK